MSGTGRSRHPHLPKNCTSLSGYFFPRFFFEIFLFEKKCIIPYGNIFLNVSHKYYPRAQWMKAINPPLCDLNTKVLRLLEDTTPAEPAGNGSLELVHREYLIHQLRKCEKWVAFYFSSLFFSFSHWFIPWFW